MAQRRNAITAALALCATVALIAFAPATGVSAYASVPQPSGNSPDDAWFALHFRPRLLFDARERWRPIDVDRFLAEPGHAVCPAGDGAVCAPLTNAAQLTPEVDHLDLRGTRANGADATAPDIATCAKSLPTLRDCDERGRSVIYAKVTRRGTRVAIDYWWFLRYNDFSLDRHEGDWEGVTVFADRSDNRVLDVHYAAHADVWRYGSGVPDVAGRRVAVFVARGSHAAYPRACTRRCRGTSGLLPETRFGGEQAWTGNTAAGCHGRCVRLLPASDGVPASWNAWDGRWGITTARVFPAPRTPAFQQRYQHPFAAQRSARTVF